MTFFFKNRSHNVPMRFSCQKNIQNETKPQQNLSKKMTLKMTKNVHAQNGNRPSLFLRRHDGLVEDGSCVKYEATNSADFQFERSILRHLFDPTPP